MSLDRCLLVGTKENLVGNREVPPLKCGWGQQLHGGQSWAGLPCPTEEPGTASQGLMLDTSTVAASGQVLEPVWSA